MAPYSSQLLQSFDARGYINQCTDPEGLDRLAAGPEPVVAYVGYDATADSLHVGHLVSIMMLRCLQRAGHRPIVLMGGGTTKVGDPSGKDETRRLLTGEQIAANIAAIERTFRNFLEFDSGPNPALLVNNADWLDGLAYIPFLRDIGRHFTINRMLTFDSVRMRLDREQPLTFLEFNYMILQAYDFLELGRRLGCRLQMGGSDQWGNIVNGIELARRVGGHELYGLTTALITTASGAKMGKTEAGAVWLSPDRLSPYDYWQFWRNTEDADVGRFLRLFTEEPLDEIARLEQLGGAEINDAKKLLATRATALAHGEAAAREAGETARRTFEQGALADGLPTVEVPRSELESGIPAFQLLRRAGLADSNGEARRLIKGGGGKLNDVRIDEAETPVDAGALNADGILKLSAGRKRHALVRAV
ncbi:MAG: tyrosine--tRNA ligase [Alphaproteobacteria bacterium]|jgi:tyrosyl-tRNA synthetase|nr:tyrosine--tRNA ligase [Alphaproteobacteria bacterium]